MKIVVIGHLCLDVIHQPGENGMREFQGYGGIFFSVATLANLLPDGGSIIPVFGAGKETHPAVVDRLGTYPNVDTSAIYKFDAPTNEVHLYYEDDQHRTECSKNIAEPIPFKRIKPHLDADMVLVNMVSGFDITLETLDEIRMTLRERHVPLYFDVHSLSLGVAADATRFRRPLIDWRRWLFWLHTVQMNEEERAGLAEEKFSEEAFAKQVTALNTPTMIVTRGSRGCSLYVDERKHLSHHTVPAVPVERSVDSTGCGDVFGAAYCAMFLAKRNTLEAATFANTIASHKAATVGSSQIDTLGRFRIGGAVSVPQGIAL
jgi:sugar/nucleoside kinase (ribokinase family)